MAFFLFAISFMISISMGPLVRDMFPCNDIIDIYYPKELESQAYDTRCKYTKTEIFCKNCGNFYISRRDYSHWVANYKKSNPGEAIPFPKRTDLDRVFPALPLATEPNKLLAPDK